MKVARMGARRRERANREAYRLSARSFFTGEARNRVARDVEKIRETRVGPSDLHMKATVFWPASLSLSLSLSLDWQRILLLFAAKENDGGVV